MELASNNSNQSTTTTPSKKKNSENTENLNPNVPNRSLSSKSPALRPSKPNNTNPVVQSPQNRIRQRKFVVAKRNNRKGSRNDAVSCKCKHNGGAKCVCVAYQTLRASQEEFFLKERKDFGEEEEEKEKDEKGYDCVTEGTKSETVENDEKEDGGSTVKRRRERDRLLEEARNSVPENGFGKVMHLVKAFEKLLTIPKNSKEKDYVGDQDQDQDREEKRDKNKVMKWALPGLQFEQQHEALEATSGSAFCYNSDLVLTSENLGLDKGISVSSSWDSSRSSVSSRTSGGRRSRRNSSESSGTFGGKRWKRKERLRVTRQQPFKLRTEQRGKLKEEEFMKKIQEMTTEEERMRVPIAQGLPWTTDEPECLLKPAVKESTKPIDPKLHTDIRAIDRAEFDQQVAEKMNFIEQLKLERERQQKLAEEEEIKRLRKELIPKAQPMPYFDRPFVPRRSMKHPTVPREPKLHLPQVQHKKMKCLLSWNDMNTYSSYLN
ncbi:SART-1 family protein DOT2 [Vigna umbellata]|uniref:SART-1 family protein DOT2 n=1 Tax=Vigna umbellata TaxID=87088 RepID=UPI001F5FB604|nr:SART-1 family protein DOT2 [Vigna umbellata]